MAPAGARLPVQTCNRIRALIDSSVPPSRIADKIYVCYKTVKRIRLSYELFGQPYPPRYISAGRKRKLTTAQMDWLLEFVSKHPTAYADEMALALFDKFEIDVCPRSIYNWLWQAG